VPDGYRADLNVTGHLLVAVARDLAGKVLGEPSGFR